MPVSIRICFRRRSRILNPEGLSYRSADIEHPLADSHKDVDRKAADHIADRIAVDRKAADRKAADRIAVDRMAASAVCCPA